MDLLHFKVILIHIWCLLGVIPAWPSENDFCNYAENCDLSIPIPEDNCITGLSFPIVVSGENQSLGSNVELSEVRIIIEHSWELDLRIYLVSPSGTSVLLSYENGTSGASNYGDINVPNCEAFTSFTADPCRANFSIADPFISGTFVGYYFPEGDFSDFNGEDPNGTWYLEICDKISGSNSGSLEHVDLLFQELNCDAPTNISVQNISALGFNLLWNTNNFGTMAAVEILELGKEPGTDATSPSGGLIEFSDTGFLSVNGLQEASTYNVFVRELCSNQSYSKNTCAFQVQTECNTSAQTIFDDFDNQNICIAECGASCNLFGLWSNSSLDNFDWLVYSGQTESVRTGPTTDVSGNGKYLYIESTDINCRDFNRAILESNCISIQSVNNNCHLSFNYHMYGFGIGSLKLEIQLEGSVDWQELWSETGDQGDQWNKQYIDLSAFHNQYVKVRFVADGANNTTGDIALDEIAFYGPFNNGTPSNTYYEDHDNDGFGNQNNTIKTCSSAVPNGFVSNSMDCDDENKNVFPGAVEITCNGLDDNCNGFADDEFISLPDISDQIICSNNLTPVLSNADAEGEYFWYKDEASAELLGVGNELFVDLSPGMHTLYIKDSISFGPGLKLTEIQLANPFKLEIQSIGVPGDYTGWKILINSAVAGPGINNFIEEPWNLGAMERNELQTRSRTEWSLPIIWTSNLPGWAVLIDDFGIARDAVFWNWSESELDDFEITFNGEQYDLDNVPWWGPAYEANLCSAKSISLIGDEEKNDSSDYDCEIVSVSISNPHLFYTSNCGSELKSIDVFVSEAPAISLDLDVDPCAGMNLSSAIDLTVETGEAPFFFNWSNDSTEEDQTDLSPGTYSVTVTSINGCFTTIEEISVGQNSSELIIELENVNDVSCYSVSDGSAIVQIEGGPAPYQFNWSIGQERDKFSNRDTLMNLSLGTYTVTVTDNNGCTTESEFFIDEPNEIFVSSELELPSCQNISDASINLLPNGGISPYEIDWNNGMNSAQIEDLNPGIYQFTLNDANDCIFISNPINLFPRQDTIALEVDQIINVQCHGESNGAIEVSAVGGSKPLSFIWSNNKTDKNINGLTAGKYSLTVSDSQSCEAYLRDVEIIEAVAELDLAYETSITSCLGQCDGSLSVNALGGMPPYSYVWSNGATETELHDLCNGFIGLTITDALGCRLIKDEEIFINSEASSLNVGVSTTPTRCFGDSNGEIQVSVSGGQFPYSFDWDRAADIQNPTFLKAGFYNCTITDNDNCDYLLENVLVEGPDSITTQLKESLPSTSGSREGALEIEIFGGTDPYIVNWFNSMNAFVGEGLRIENLNPGNYTAKIIDFHSCMQSVDGFVVDVINANENVYEINRLNLFPNPVSHILYFELDGIVDKQNLRIEIFDVLGKSCPGNYLLHFDENKGSMNIKELDAAVYLLKIYDTAGVVAIQTFVKI